jgi:hypothetical protein
VQAQVIGGVSVSPQPAKTGEPVTVTATVDVINANYCGFIVFFGDGTSVEGVSDSTKTGPLVTTHTYAKPGEYTVSMGGRHVQSHPNCGGADKTVVVKVEGPAKSGAMTKSAAASACPDKWKLVSKSFSAKTGAFACSARPGTALPETKPACAGDLTYYENAKKGQFGCRP